MVGLNFSFRPAISFFLPLVVPVRLNLINEQDIFSSGSNEVLHTGVGHYAGGIVSPVDFACLVGVLTAGHFEEDLAVVLPAGRGVPRPASFFRMILIVFIEIILVEICVCIIGAAVPFS